MAKRHLLSKSTFISGLQCKKKLYLSKKHRDLASPRTAAAEAIMKQGTSMGELAQFVFPNGKDATPEYYWDYAPSIAQTKTWIEAGEPTIYEAAFQANGVMAALDIFIHKNGERIALEVKSSTSVKEYHLNDAALQYWVMEQAGFKPDRFFIMHLNNQYVREGKIKVRRLFHWEEVTEVVLARQKDIADQVQELKGVLQATEVPQVDIGAHCSEPFACEFAAHCWRHIPENSIFEVSGLGKKAWNYYEQGILAIKDLPEEDTFSTLQQLQIAGVKNGQKVIEKKEIEDFLGDWQFPLYFFDFETINPALPPYDGCRPYEQLGVQYSLHVLKDDASLMHSEFLAQAGEDPRKEMVEKILQSLGSSGSIVAYNMGFEKRVIQSLANTFPEYQKQLEALLDRFVDLMIPFQKGWYYLPEMQGSYSIKAVLPALFPKDKTLDYSALSIGNGSDASVYLQAMLENRVQKEELTDLRKELLAYCKLDTLAMVKIWEVLKW